MIYTRDKIFSFNINQYTGLYEDVYSMDFAKSYSALINKDIKNKIGCNRIVYQKYPQKITFENEKRSQSVSHTIFPWSFSVVISLTACYDFHTLWTQINKTDMAISLIPGQYAIIPSDLPLFHKDGEMPQTSVLITGEMMKHTDFVKHKNILNATIGDYYGIV